MAGKRIEGQGAKAGLSWSMRPQQLLVACVSGYAMFRLTEQGEIANWNPGARRIVGYEIVESLADTSLSFTQTTTESITAHGCAVPSLPYGCFLPADTVAFRRRRDFTCGCGPSGSNRHDPGSSATARDDVRVDNVRPPRSPQPPVQRCRPQCRSMTRSLLPPSSHKVRDVDWSPSVSYTHLTLPTN